MLLQRKSFVFKAHDRRYMFLISSNAYRDREQDIVKEKALNNYVNHFQRTPHLYWHGGDPIGEIVGAKMVGPFLLELSQELPNEIIDLKRFDDDEPMEIERAKVWDALEKNSIQWGSSIGFAHKAGDEQDHEFERILKVETSTLPLSKAANGITPSFVIGGQPMSEATKQDRRNLFEKLLGKTPASELEAAIEGVQNALDKAGVERKELDMKKTKGLVEEMQTRIMDILAELTDDEAKRQGLANMIAAELMGTATEVVEELPELEVMQDDDEEEEFPEAMMELTNQVKALAEESTDVQNEMKELIPAVVEMAGVVKELAPLVEKTQALDDLVERLAKVEKFIALTPRVASTDKETVVERAAVKNEIDKSLRGEKTVLGIPVKE